MGRISLFVLLQQHRAPRCALRAARCALRAGAGADVQQIRDSPSSILSLHRRYKFAGGIFNDVSCISSRTFLYMVTNNRQHYDAHRMAPAVL
jgi:hypothetical protein